jgi:hypothetical protein
MLHANFVAAVLNDLFGIQARSGCFCAGPYIHRLSAIDDDTSARMQEAAANGQMGAVLSFTRVSFNYFISETAFNYILDAVHLIADHGWKVLPLYRFDPASGLWRHRAGVLDTPVDLRDAFAGGGLARVATASENVLARQLEAARRIITAVEADPPASVGEALSDEFERIRWFALAGEGRLTGRELTI